MHLAWGMLLLPAAVAQLTATNFVKYYNYDGGLVSGTVTVTSDGTSQTLAYSLSDTEIGCAGGAGPADNSCGVHIHSGMTCTADAGGHWYDDETITEDPWASVSYIGVTSASDTTDPVDTGYDDAVGRALIIHGYDGGRIGCAILGAAPPSPPVGASIMQDPHMDLAHNGHADFRGKHKSLYNYLSTPGLSVNVLIEEALYTLHDGSLLVNGTYMTAVYVAALVEGDSLCK